MAYDDGEDSAKPSDTRSKPKEGDFSKKFEINKEDSKEKLAEEVELH